MSIDRWLDKEAVVYIWNIQSVQFSCSAVSDSLWPHKLQHTRPPCPSPTPEVHPNPCPLNGVCHPTISSSVIPFSSCLQSFPASWSFPMSWLFPSDGQSVGASTLASVLPIYIQDSFRIDWFDLLAVQRTLKRLLQHHHSKGINSLILSFLYSPTLTSIHYYWKSHSFY